MRAIGRMVGGGEKDLLELLERWEVGCSKNAQLGRDKEGSDSK